MNNNTFELLDICKTYQHHRVLSQLSLSLKGGEPTLLLGANGSGKSTLLKICTQLARADSGKVLISSVPASRKHLSSFGYFGHEPLMYENLTVGENLKLLVSIMKLKVVLDDYFERWELGKIQNKKLLMLSKGQLARVALAKTFLHSPAFVFLDEPTASLDNASFDLFIRNIQSYLDQSTAPPVLLIASHDVGRMSEWCDRIVVLNSMAITADSAAKGPDKKTEIVTHYRESLH